MNLIADDYQPVIETVQLNSHVDKVLYTITCTLQTKSVLLSNSLQTQLIVKKMFFYYNNFFFPFRLNIFNCKSIFAQYTSICATY